MSTARSELNVDKPRMPTCLPGFESINRYWDKQQQQFTAKILPGEYYVSKQKEMITTVLGSCISVCIHDPIAEIGGMNHFMLPKDKGNSSEFTSESFRYGDAAMEMLVNELMRNGAERHRLVFKAFGGGQIIKTMMSIGRDNISFLHKFMTMEGFKLTSSDLGGPHPRKVRFFSDTGKVQMKKLQHMHNDTITRRESSYQSRLKTEKVASGDIDLF